MKIINTAALLIFTILIVPYCILKYGNIPTHIEYGLIKQLSLITFICFLSCFIIGELTKNNSQVDKIWSIVPILYTGIIAFKGNFDGRLLVMFLLVLIWGARLTWNFSLKDAYKWKFWEGEEDYRWVVLRQKPEFQPKWKWTLFNMFFISGYQNILILLFTLPIIKCFSYMEKELNYVDYLAAGLMLLFIVYEGVADLQHWKFQSRKWELIKNNDELTGDYKKGFLDKGLWAYSRHPNYFAEQMIWVSFYLFSIAASGQWINWSIMGCLLLILLFQGSANFSEEISQNKYPDYRNFQIKVNKFIPWFSKGIVVD
jgi:steroid 5-alpha reductase family enzyme